MGVLEKVMDLKGRGVPENEIINDLREQGISPGAISEALNQAKIKSAVSSEDNIRNKMEPSIMGPEGAESPPRELPTEGAVSDVDLTPAPPSSYQTYQPQRISVSQEIPEEEYVPRPQGESYARQIQQEYQQPYQSEEYMPEYYPSQEYEYGYSTTGRSDTDTLIEVAEQVFSEKVKPLQKYIEDLNEFKILVQTKIDNISDRLKRIESNIDKLQAEILERVGSYGRGLENVKKEMGMVQESFGKIVNTLADKTEEKRKHSVSGKTHLGDSKVHSSKKKFKTTHRS